ncbi:MAG TPA: DNA polymerase III subunit delta [Planctomycetia bacterium]|nr:DNA polymerase III subunit delta [Planctomycetia bacterium]
MSARPCIDFVTKKRRGEVPGVCVAFGDDAFLRRLAFRAVRDWTLGDADPELALTSFTADDLAAATVFDELDTLPFTGGRRLVVIDNADKFVTENRARLEKYVEAGKFAGVLFLDVRTWSAATKLAKVVELAIDCNAPRDHFVPGWCVKWAAGRYEKDLSQDDASWLVHLVGAELGVLDQELAKLTSYVGEETAITREAIDALAAGNPVDATFKMIDAALAGNLAGALAMLDRQYDDKDRGLRTHGAICYSLRRLVEGARRAVAGEPLDEALKNAGVHPYGVREAEAQLKRIGRERMAGMYRLALSADLDLKGGTAIGPRTVLERMLLQLSRAASPRASK